MEENNLRLVNSRGRVLLEVTKAVELAYGAIEYTFTIHSGRFRPHSILCRSFYDSRFAFDLKRDGSGSLAWWIENVKQDNPSAKLVGELPVPAPK